MSFTVKKITAEGLGSIGVKLGGNGSVAVQSGSLISMAHAALTGDGFYPVSAETPKQVATVQSGMSFNTPKGPR